MGIASKKKKLHQKLTDGTQYLSTVWEVHNFSNPLSLIDDFIVPMTLHPLSQPCLLASRKPPVFSLGDKVSLTVTQVENTSSASEAQALGPEFSKQRTPVASQIGMGVSSYHSTEERIRNIEIHLGYRPGQAFLRCQLNPLSTKSNQHLIYW